MRILWITNTIFPVPSTTLGLSLPVVGGWMYALAMQLISNKKIELAIATVYPGKGIKSIEIDGILYFLLPAKSKTEYKRTLETSWLKICNEYNPDLIHIHGTEYTHGLACMRSCPNFRYVVSIQGLISIYSRYFLAGIKPREIFKYITLRDLIKVDSLFHANRKLRNRGIFEKEYILRTHHIIGRTSWDYAHVKTVNPNVKYHFCNETLRESFYTTSKWDINNKTDYTIFLSQASEPLKGLHQVIKAIALLKSDFPEIKLRVSGPNILRNSIIFEKIKRGGYAAYIQNLIDKFNLNKQICFVGPLLENKMVSEYINAHVFICPSSIENSPNSLGEAQLIGVPTISSYVGGIPDMISHEKTGLLYRFEEVEMLADNIRKVFTDNVMAQNLSKNGIQAAEKRHDRQINRDQTIHIYNTILNTSL